MLLITQSGRLSYSEVRFTNLEQVYNLLYILVGSRLVSSPLSCILNLLCSLRSYLYFCPPPLSQQMTLTLSPETNIRETVTFLPPVYSASTLFFKLSLNVEAESSKGRPFPPPEFMNLLHSPLLSQLSLLLSSSSLYWLIPLKVQSQGWQTLFCVYRWPRSIFPKKAGSSGNTITSPSTRG